MLHDLGIDLSAQVLCYPFLDFSGFSGLLDSKDAQIADALFFPKGVSRNDPYVSPAAAADRQLRGLCPTVFVCCGKDPLTEHARKYQHMLEKNGTAVSFQLYDEALHGFLEVNHREYPAQEAKNPQQKALAEEAEDDIASKLREIWTGE